VLGELVPGHGVGPERFSEMLVDALVREPSAVACGFRGLPLGAWSADPSSFYGADKAGGQLAWVETVMKAVGHRIDPAPTNEPAIRIEGVRHYLARRIDANTPAFLIDPRCRMLIAGFSGKYRYRRVRIGVTERLEDRPFKDEYSDPHDALQYLVLGFRGRAGVIESAARAGRPGNVVQLPVRRPARTDFDVWSV